MIALRSLRTLVVALSLGLGLVAFSGQRAAASGDAHGNGEFKVSELLFHHILDSHSWHLVDLPAGNGHYTPISIPLPWIIYTAEKGLDIFFLTGHSEAELQAQAAARGYELHHEKIRLAGNPEALVLDFSITKTVFQMILVGLILVLLLTSVAKAYARRPGEAPRGLQNFFETVIVFVRDDIAKPNLGDKHERFLPYLLTLFFFIWTANILGLTPLNSNIMGNISVTVALATLTFLLVQFNGSKDHWQHVFWYPGVPVPVKLIMLPVEVVGLFSKPFSLTVRLFANIAAGHFMVLSLISLIFLLGKQGQNPGGALAILPLSLIFNLFIMSLEILVAAIQAYVFTLLTAVFLGMAMASHDHHEHEHAAH